MLVITSKAGNVLSVWSGDLNTLATIYPNSPEVLELYQEYQLPDDPEVIRNPTAYQVVDGQIAPVDKPAIVPDYRDLRRAEYPPPGDFADCYVKQQAGDPAPMEAYVTYCLTVKAKYPKPK